ncbi:MAG: TIGR00375 family protein [bacterium]|nr:TIGR00375 family protein [bacterium]
MKIFADLHIHSSFAGGTSKFISVEELARTAKLKGLHVLGTGDILLPAWRKHLLEKLERVDEGTLELGGVRFVPTAEIEDKHRVHHLLLFKDFAQVEELYERLKRCSPNIDKEGRPRVLLSGAELADILVDLDVAFGPAHAFVPWTSIYKSFNSLKECYDEHWKRLSFLELGLSADTYMADRIAELQELPFLSNSDAHSAYPHRLGREFNQLEVEEPTAEQVVKAVQHRRVTLNAGLDPREGKYHCTACARCKTKFTLEQAQQLNWRCPLCGGTIKKGVRDRIEELATWKEPRHPPFRPKYYHIIPLTEIIQRMYGYSSPTTRAVLKLYENFVEKLGPETEILLFKPYEELKKVMPEELVEVVRKMREDKLEYIAGGGGQYGVPLLTGKENIKDKWYSQSQQKNLLDFI